MGGAAARYWRPARRGDQHRGRRRVDAHRPAAGAGRCARQRRQRIQPRRHPHLERRRRRHLPATRRRRAASCLAGRGARRAGRVHWLVRCWPHPRRRRVRAGLRPADDSPRDPLGEATLQRLRRPSLVDDQGRDRLSAHRDLRRRLSSRSGAGASPRSPARDSTSSCRTRSR